MINNPYNNIYSDCLNKMDIKIHTHFYKNDQQKIKKIFTSIFYGIQVQELKQVDINIKQKNHFLNILKNIPNLPSKYKNLNNMSKKNIYEYFENNVEFSNFLRTQDLTSLFKKLNYNHFPIDILNEFIVPEIFDDIIDLNYKKIIQSNYNSNKVNLDMFYTKPLDNLKIILILIKIYCLLEIYNIQNQNFSIVLFFTDCKKQINNNKNLTSKNVNSGLTFSGIDTFQIYIFREEEVEKVIIHELIHAMNIDINFRKDFLLYENSIKCHFNVSKKNKINIFEAFTESFAVYYNTMFNCILTDTSFQDIFTDEIKFSLLQAIKILQFYKLSIDDFFQKDKCFLGNDNWIEKSSILSYYFLKTITILNMDKFFNQDINNNASYFKFLIDNSNEFIKLLNKYQSLTDKCFDKSLRMTLYELKLNI